MGPPHRLAPFLIQVAAVEGPSSRVGHRVSSPSRGEGPPGLEAEGVSTEPAASHSVFLEI